MSNSEKIFAHALAGHFKMAEYNHEEVICLIDWMHKNSTIYHFDTPSTIELQYKLNQPVSITDCVNTTTEVAHFFIRSTTVLYYTFGVFNTGILFNVYRLPDALNDEVRKVEFRRFKEAKQNSETQQKWKQMEQYTKKEWVVETTPYKDPYKDPYKEDEYDYIKKYPNGTNSSHDDSYDILNALKEKMKIK